jgi:type I restriction enzyme, S subunit
MLTHRAATILGDIPPDWGRALLATLLSGQQGGDWGDDSGEVPVRVLRSTNFTDRGTLTFDDVETRYFSTAKSAEFTLKDGDLLVERSGGGPTQPVGRVGFIPRSLPNHWFSNFVQLLRPDSSEINPEYLGWLLLELNRSGVVERLQHQTTQMRNLDFRDYLRIYLPKPPLEEQKEIARILRTANDSLILAEQKLAAARRLRTALMQQLFARGMPGRHTRFRKTKWFQAPSCWPLRQLREVAAVQSGFTMGRDLSGYETVEVAYLTVINVQEGSFDLSNVQSVQVKVSEVGDLMLRPGDVLMTEGGDRDKLGRGGLWHGQIHPCVYQNHIFRIRFHSNTYKPELFHFLLQTWHAKNYFYAHAKQTSNLCTINSRELKRFPFFEPPPAEQEEMVSLLLGANSELSAIESEITCLDQLKRSLLQNLLTGRVRVKV